jgi:hypothetical protein
MHEVEKAHIKKHLKRTAKHLMSKMRPSLLIYRKLSASRRLQLMKLKREV